MASSSSHVPAAAQTKFAQPAAAALASPLHPSTSSANSSVIDGNSRVASSSDVAIYDVINPDPSRETPAVFKLDSPLVTLYHDFWILLRNAPVFPLILYPIPAIGVDVTTSGIIVQIILIAVSILITTLAMASIVTGVPPPVLVGLGLVLWVAAYNSTQHKDRVTYPTVPGSDNFDKETWLFVNGIGTSRDGLQLILDAFYELFGRKVIGVENRSFGIWFDLLECVLQRDLVWQTTDTREGYNIITRHILHPKKDKIVLLAHSQGGIIMSSWVDQLLADFSPAQLKKVEIYTFASAANHFSIPGNVFGRVEHFVNTRDYVSCIGLLAFAPPAPGGSINPAPGAVKTVQGRFAGRIFKRLEHTGHLLLTHYLKDGDSILKIPAVANNSKLASYLK